MSEMTTGIRRRMPKAERHAQLLRVAREFVREEGSDALTLARLAERAGVTKPLVYQHFGTKSAVLAKLYYEFKARTHTALDAALGTADADLAAVSRIISDAYIDCIDAEDAELPGVAGALSGSPEMEALRQRADSAFSARCRCALEPFTPDGELPEAALHAILGAADGIARAIVLKQITSAQGKTALAKVVMGVVKAEPT